MFLLRQNPSLDPDNPPCFKYRLLNNGEKAVEAIQRNFRALMGRTAQMVREYLEGPPPTEVERRFVVS